jgi:parvulin-like peptidyl-prolyl isomerase
MPGPKYRRHSDGTFSLTGRILFVPIAYRGRIPKIRTGIWLAIFCVYLAGIASGYLIETQRRRAQDVIVAINGVPIRGEELRARMAQDIGGDTLSQLVKEEMIFQLARQKRVVPADIDIYRRAEQLSAELARKQGLTKSRAPSEPMLRLARLQLVRESLASTGVVVTEAETRAYYKVQIDPSNTAARFYTPGRIDAAIIVSPNEKDVRLAWAKLQSGKAFGDVARKYSKDRTASEGGKVTLVLHGRAPSGSAAAFNTKLFELTPGDQIPPAKYGGVWWIARCLNRTAPKTAPFDEVKQACYEGARSTLGVAAHGRDLEAELLAFRKKASIQVFWPQYYDLAAQWRQ